MRFYLDTEFIDDGQAIALISIGLMAEDGRKFYAESTEFDPSKADDWVKANVIDPLWSRQEGKDKFNKWGKDGGEGGFLSRREIASSLVSFLGESPQIWGEWCSYDWVAFCQLFGNGKMIDLPTGYPYRCRDVVQLCEDSLGLSTEAWPKSLETEGNHNALLGAETVKARYDWCQSARLI